MLTDTDLQAFLTLNELPNAHFQQLHEGALVRTQYWEGGAYQTETENGSSWGFLQTGEAVLTYEGLDFPLRRGMYFSAPGGIQLSGAGRAILITQENHQAFFNLGGPIEEKGRLQYIDGCTDSLLLAPPLFGDPCLNLLHIPPQTFQSQHTHPSLRAGIVVSGWGQCITPDGTYDLRAGLAFVIPAEAQHSFTTQDEALRVIAYHPDSDFGPTHEQHPMINRTYLSNGDK